MQLYVNLVIVGLIVIGFSAFISFQISDKNIIFISTVLSFIISLSVTHIFTRKMVEDEYDKIIHKMKDDYNVRMRKLKHHHDATTLEKTIRDGTRTLIKNAVDYFKIENIKNEMGPSAAMQNLQLDKYGQIIELLADFSLILPDIQENQEIVSEEICHQIDIYKIDEKAFALFLQRIMDKYLITVNKKIKEKSDQYNIEELKRCPKCAEKVLPDAKICKHCRHEFTNIPKRKSLPQPTTENEWIKRGKMLYNAGNYEEAVKIFSNVIEKNPKLSQAFYNRGIVYEKTGNQSQALKDLKSASELGHKKAQEFIQLLTIMEEKRHEHS